MGMIKRIRNPNQADILYLNEPETVAEYNPEITKSPQMLSAKTYAIKLLASIFNDETLCEATIQIVNETIRDYPELALEVLSLIHI